MGRRGIWRHWQYTWLALVMGSLYIPHVQATASPEVIVSEISWAGSSVSSADEWLELRNTTDRLISLNGWSLWNAATTPAGKLVSLSDSQIAPQGTFLITHVSADHIFTAGQSVLNVEPDLVSADLSLSNTHLKIDLRDAQGKIVDTVGNGGAGFLRDPNVPRSMERLLNPVRPGDQSSAWRLSTKVQGLDPGVPDVGTPTPSGRPSIVLASDQSCRFGVNQTVLTSIEVRDPNGLEDLARVTVAQNDVLLPVTVDQATQHLNITVPAATGPSLLTVVAQDRGGLSATRTIACEIVQTEGDVSIEEVAPAPANGEREFVELRNVGQSPVDLYGWSIDDRDGSGRPPFIIPYSQVLASDQRIAFWDSETKLAFNNTGDDVQLIRPNGVRADLVRYENAPSSQSWNRNQPWYWSVPSPGRPNNGPIVVSSGQGGATTNLMLPTVSLDELVVHHRLFAGTAISTEGSVVVEQGAYDDRHLVLGTATASLELQFPVGVVASYPRGTVLRVTGKVSAAGTPRLLVDDLGLVSVLGKSGPIVTDLTTVETPALFQFLEGSGQVIEVNPSPTIQAGTIVVHLTRRESIHFPALAPGQTVKFRGLVTDLDPLRLKLLSGADIQVTGEPEPSSPEPEKSEVSMATTPLIQVSPSLPSESAQLAVTGTLQHLTTRLPLQTVLAVVSSLQTRAQLTNALARRVLDARTKVTVPQSASVPWLVVSSGALIGCIVLWIDWLVTSLARRLQNVP